VPKEEESKIDESLGA